MTIFNINYIKVYFNLHWNNFGMDTKIASKYKKQGQRNGNTCFVYNFDFVFKYSE